MEFQQILQKLKYSDRLNRSMLTKEIVANIRCIHRIELLDILEMLNSTSDMEFQVTLLSILSAYLLLNNANRDVVIKWTSLYDTLNTILARGLPMKTAVTLNFVTALLFAEDDGVSKSKTLTLHAQSMLRSSGCLTTITHLFANYMLYADTWKALCRCVAEVCRGFEANQTFCSHLVPLCVQRCLQGNLDVLPVLHSLLYNHKRNCDLFLQVDGTAVFKRIEYLRNETCLQLLNTVIRNIDVTALTVLKTQADLEEHLRDLLTFQGHDSRASQWATINLYYLETKLKGKDTPPNKSYKRENKLETNIRNGNDVEDTIVNDTRTLFHNIMTEIRSCSSKPIRYDQNPWKHLCKFPNNLSNKNDLSQRNVNETKLYCHERNSFHKIVEPQRNPSAICNEQLTFSFLMDGDFRDDGFDVVNRNDRSSNKHQTFKNPLTNINRKQRNNYSEFCDSHQTLNNDNENVIEFKPVFVSTPIKLISAKRSVLLNKKTPVKSYKSNYKNGIRKYQPIRNRTILDIAPKKIQAQQNNSIKHRSMSSRLLEAINESCTTFMKSVRNVFTGNKNSKSSCGESIKNQTDADQDERSYCSYSFLNYMQKREAELIEQSTKQTDCSLMNTHNATDKCKTCDDTLLLKHKLANDDQLKLTLKKLKLGINLYGCDFKKMSRTMWPREAYMTPSVLYNLYRKLILK